jgi:hypothetical protein
MTAGTGAQDAAKALERWLRSGLSRPVRFEDASQLDPAGDVYVQDLNSSSVLEVPVSGPSTVSLLTAPAFQLRV